jgi:hypothetical protein
VTRKLLVRDACKLLIGWLLSFGLIGTLNWWLLSRGFRSDDATGAFAKSLIVATSPAPLAKIVVTFPQVPLLLASVARAVPGGASPALPYVLGALLASFVPAWLYGKMRREGCGILSAASVAFLLTIHPMFLWAGTTGVENAATLLIYIYFSLSLLRIAWEQDARGFMMLAITLPLLLFSSPVAGLLMGALLLLLPVALPRSMVSANPAAGYVAAFVPPAIAVLSWIYISWIFHVDWRTVIFPEFSKRLLSTDLETLWRLNAGFDYFALPVVLSFFAVAAAPLLFATMRWTGVPIQSRRAIFVASLAPVLVALFEIAEDRLSHPAPVLMLLCAALIAVVRRFPDLTIQSPFRVAGLLLLGALGGAAFLQVSPSSEFVSWQQSLLGKHSDALHLPERSVGKWLAAEKEETILDVTGAYPLIAARASASHLLLPGVPDFGVQLQANWLSTPQFVVPDPATAQGALNVINRRYPSAYSSGMQGYTLAYDSDGWRVYRLAALPGLPASVNATDIDSTGAPEVWIWTAAILAVLAGGTALLSLLAQMKSPRKSVLLSLNLNGAEPERVESAPL